MFVVISPAKKLDFETSSPIKKDSEIRYPDETFSLIKELRKCSADEISKLMKLSDSLTELNVERYKKYDPKFKKQVSKQAVFAFAGDTYIGLDANSLAKEDILYSQEHLGILSGLYGLLRPLDIIQPYRLEMGTRFPTKGCKNLYDFWSTTVTTEINKILKKEKYLVNLSSNEYFSVINDKEVKGDIITPVFKEKKGDQYKVVSFNAKRARGMMSRYIIENKLSHPKDLKKFNMDHYQYNSELSSEFEPTFTRG